MANTHFKMRTLIKVQLDSKLCWALCNVLLRRNLNKLDGDIELDQKSLLAEFGRELAGHMQADQPHPLAKLSGDNEKVLSWYALSADRKRLKEAINKALAAINDKKSVEEVEELLRDGISKARKDGDE